MSKVAKALGCWKKLVLPFSLPDNKWDFTDDDTNRVVSKTFTNVGIVFIILSVTTIYSVFAVVEIPWRGLVAILLLSAYSFALLFGHSKIINLVLDHHGKKQNTHRTR